MNFSEMELILLRPFVSQASVDFDLENYFDIQRYIAPDSDLPRLPSDDLQK